MLISRKRSAALHIVSLHLNGEDLQVPGCHTLQRTVLVPSHKESLQQGYRQVLGVLYRHFYPDCNASTLVQLFVSLVCPHLEYACPVWTPYSSKDISKLDTVQKFALRMASHNWSARYSDLLDGLNIPSLESRRSQLKTHQLYKIVNGLCFFPPGLINMRQRASSHSPLHE